MSDSPCRACGATTDAFLCRECGEEIARALGEAKSLMHEVSNVAIGQTNVYRANAKQQTDEEASELDEEYGWRLARTPAHLRSPQGRITLPSTPPVVNLAARELLWEAGNTLSSWARELSESRGVLIPEDWLTWLTDNAESFRFSEGAEQAHEEITYICGRMTRAVDRSPSRLYAGPCHAKAEGSEPLVFRGECQRDLYAWPGADVVTCDGHRSDGIGCGAEHTKEQRKKWLTESVSFAMLPLTMWWQCLPSMFPELRWPPRQTWWRWAEAKGEHQRFISAAHDPETGQPLYSGRHVLEVVQQYQQFRETRGGRRSA